MHVKIFYIKEIKKAARQYNTACYFFSILMMAGYNRFICFQELGRRGLAVVFALNNIKWLGTVYVIGEKRIKSYKNNK